MKRYLFILIFVILSLQLPAQLFPVRTITNVSAPYPLSLEQYGSIDLNHITLTIIPNDIILQNYPVKLKLVISGGNFKIYTHPDFIHREILLNNGETMIFTGAELAEWFNPNNLVFEGYTKTQYLNTGRLPEGIYQVWFEVWDYYRGFNFSGSDKATVWTFENEPPILNFPENKKELEPFDPQNIVFNWSLRQSPFSTAGLSNNYKFELWEVEPDNLSAEEAVRSLRPIYTTEITSNILNYTAAEPLLFKGKKYAWRIQVFDPFGNTRYKNNGYSEVRWFRFGKDIPVPTLTLDKTTTSTISVKWENDYRISKYELRWRNKDIKNSNWYTKDATGQTALIDKLEQNTGYEIQLHGYTGAQDGEYSPSLLVRTKQDISFACGGAPGATDSASNSPLLALAPGEFFKASDFEVQVYEVSGSNGTFTGKGFVLVPLLKFIKFQAEFKGIQISSQRRMTKGEVKFIYNEMNGLTVNLKKLFDDLTKDKPTIVEVNPFTDIADRRITPGADVTGITVDANGLITVTTDDGHTIQIRGADGEMIAVNGGTDDAEQYVVDPQTGTVYKGTPEKGTGGSGSLQPVSKDGSALYSVNFLPHILGGGGMDIPTAKAPALNYDEIKVGGTIIKVPWKSVEKNKIDRIVAQISGTPADSVKYVTDEGNLVMTAPSDKSHVNYNVPGFQNSGNQSYKQILVTGTEQTDKLKAWYPEYKQVNDTTKQLERILAGQVNLASYDKINLEVCIVELNGAAVPDALPIESELNRIFKSSLVQWKVSRIKDFKVTIEGMNNGTFDNTDPDDDMDYTDHEKQVKNAFKKRDDYNRQTLYLFFIDGNTIDRSQLGYMPFNSQFGFIFRDNQDINELIRTIAHELGHGAFRLRHPFSNQCPYPQTKGDTYNLMDYVDAGKATSAILLHKYQWDEVHDWDLGANWFEGEEEGESIKAKNFASEMIASGANWTGRITCLTPAGNPYTVPSDVSELMFVTNISYSPKGALVGFKLVNGDLYVATYWSSTKEFIGYAKVINSKAQVKLDRVENNGKKPIPKEDDITRTLGDNTDVYIGYQKPCEIDIYTIKLSEVKQKIKIENYTGGGICELEIKFNTAVPKAGLKDNAACITGIGLAFYNEYYSTAKTDEERQHIIEIAKLYTDIGSILLTAYSEKAWDEQKPYYAFYHLNYNHWGYTFEQYKTALEKYLQKFRQYEQLIKKAEEQSRVVMWVDQLSDLEIKALPLDLRLHALKVLTSKAMMGDIFQLINTSNEEVTAVRLIKYIPEDQASSFLASIKESGLLKLLDYRFDDTGWPYNDGNYAKFVLAFRELVAKANAVKDQRQLASQLYLNKKVFWWGGHQKYSTLLSGSKECPFKYTSVYKDGVIKITLTEPSGVRAEYMGPTFNTSKLECTYNQPVTFDDLKPDEYILIYIDPKSKFGEEIGLTKARAGIVPAIALHYLINEQANANARKAISTMVDIALFSFGIGQLQAVTKIHKVITIIDIIASSSDIAINIFEDDILLNCEDGQKFINLYRNIVLITGVLNIGSSIYDGRIAKLLDNDITELAKVWENVSSKLTKEKFDKYDALISRLKKEASVVGDIADVGDEIAEAIKKWDNLTSGEVKSLFFKVSKSEIVGSKTVRTQEEILNELNIKWEQERIRIANGENINYTKNPYSFTNEIADYSLTKEALFVRIHNVNNPNRPWLIAIEDFKKFSSQEDMIDKLALPILGDDGKIIKPTELSLVKLPIGTKVRKSFARPQDWPGLGHQSGGAVQFEIRDNLNIPPDWFKSTGKISDYLN